MALRRPVGVLFIGLLVASLAIVACGGGGSSDAGASTGQRAFVGKVNGAEAYIGILYDGAYMFVYLTDGKELALSYRGPIGVAGAGYFNLRNETGAAIEGRVAGDGYSGTVALGPGQNFTFSTDLAKGNGGIYREKGTDSISGWVVLNDGQFKGTRRTATGAVEPIAVLGGVKWMDPTAEP